MYTLYYAPGTCSLAVHAVLAELGQPFEAKSTVTEKGKFSSPEFLKVNPRGQVPTLVDDGFVIREGGAILVYLLDKHQSPLLPRSGHERAAALEWLMFCNATLHPAYGRIFMLNKKLQDKDAAKPVYEAFEEAIHKLWSDIETRLSESPFLAGKECTAADILATVISGWQAALSKPVAFGPNTQRMLSAVQSRPAYQHALKDEQGGAKAAA